MVLILKHNPVIFKTFQHYTRKEGEDMKGPNQIVTYFTSVLNNLCLQNISESTRRFSRRSSRTKKLKTPDRLKAARRTRRRLRLRRRRRRRGGKSFNPHTLIKAGLQNGQMGALAKSLQKPDRIHMRLTQLYDALT